MVDIDESKIYSDYIETVNAGSLYATKDNQNNPEKVFEVDVHEVAELKAELKVAGKQINFVVDTAASSHCHFRNAVPENLVPYCPR